MRNFLLLIIAILLNGSAWCQTSITDKTIIEVEVLNKWESEMEGELHCIEGTYKHPKEKVAFSTPILVLIDGRKIILSLGSDNKLNDFFVQEKNNKRIKVLGRVYLNDIPEKYGIISRTTDAYMVDIQQAELSD